MTKDGDGRRFPGAPLPIGTLIPAVTRPAFRKRSPAGAQVLADWAQIVGPALAAVTTPVRLSAGTLTLACSGPIAMELQHLAPELIARINGQLGRAAVERLRFVQQAGPPGARPPPPPAPPAAVPTPVRERLSDLPDGELRQALEKLAGRVYRKC
ncbi:DUF721 domain-containing protein [Falsiroseomonas oryziterrae]|uniref:DUF721 domain-containing protein n=1 Tax=Falsiroseomonas oryziterrae TaxID=2911368 RepID=UPI001F187C6A|nr:DUF721 domain-containing protein [Roseomonas sp. NPKOSM-4]